METTTLIRFAAFINILVLVIYFVFNRRIIFNERRKSNPDHVSTFEIETKTNIRFMFMAASLILPILIFMGISSLKDATRSIETKVSDDLKGFDKYKDSISQMKDTMDLVVYSFNEVRQELDSINEIAKNTQANINQKQKSIDAIENRLSVQTKQLSDIKNFVFLSPISFEESYLDGPTGNQPLKAFFKDLKTSSGLPLPAFENPPRVIQLNSEIDVYILKVTSDFIEYKVGGYQEIEGGIHEIQYLIFY